MNTHTNTHTVSGTIFHLTTLKCQSNGREATCNMKKALKKTNLYAHLIFITSLTRQIIKNSTLSTSYMN